jgi:hypothetical protein
MGTIAPTATDISLQGRACVRARVRVVHAQEDQIFACIRHKRFVGKLEDLIITIVVGLT